MENRRNVMRLMGAALGSVGFSSRVESVFAEKKKTRSQVDTQFVSAEDAKSHLLSRIPNPPNEHVVMQAITAVCYKVDGSGITAEEQGITLQDCQFFPQEARVFPIDKGKIPDIIPGSE
jgi:hypothetical protein